MRINLGKREVHSPRVGDIKIVRKFLWWPLKLGKEVRWFEYADIKLEYQEVGCITYHQGNILVDEESYGWVKLKFL